MARQQAVACVAALASAGYLRTIRRILRSIITFRGARTGNMSLWQRFLGRETGDALKPQRLDYLNEGLALERQGDYDAALTSYRLAYRDNPADPRILLNMAIICTKVDQQEEAVRHYRRALELDDSLSGAHYGLAFLLLKRHERDEARVHLQHFLARPPRGPDAERWVRHAETALRELDATPAPDVP
jgi:tetratricopeptide (TPR) repeat protein